MGAIGSDAEYALILSVTEFLLGLAPAHAKVIVRVWMNFSEPAKPAHLNYLSTVMRITEGLLKDNFDNLLGAGDALDYFARR